MLENPIAAELDCMRPSILPNLIQAAARNAARGHADVALFEIGPVYAGDRPGDQRTAITALVAPHAPRHWSGSTESALFALKADLYALLETLGAPVGSLQLVEGQNRDWWRPGQSAVIDKGVHMGHLKWTLETFVARFFEMDAIEARFRPHHFPFTEPSAEMDIRCDRSGGELKLNQGDSWMEILGCGMVHPNVLRACGLDPDEWQGFAFGMGVDRLAMLKYGIPDLRPMFEADTRWLSHYGFSPFVAPNLATGLS